MQPFTCQIQVLCNNICCLLASDTKMASYCTFPTSTFAISPSPETGLLEDPLKYSLCTLYLSLKGQHSLLQASIRTEMAACWKALELKNFCLLDSPCKSLILVINTNLYDSYLSQVLNELVGFVQNKLMMCPYYREMLWLPLLFAWRSCGKKNQTHKQTTKQTG